jgi:hypothetical protein
MINLRRLSPICPKCKSLSTYDVIPNLPETPEHQLQALDYNLDYYAIGNAKFYCMTCNHTWKKYRGKKPYERITKISASTWGFPGPNYELRIDFVKKTIEYSTTLYDRKRPGIDLKKLNDNEIKWLLNRLYECNLLNWAEEYEVNGLVCDGTHWSVRIEYDTYCEIKTGSNHFPDKWTRFCKVISKLSDNEFY